MIYKFAPIFKPTPWGGSRIREMKGLPPSVTPIGESWELSAVEGMESVVDSGPEEGLTLRGLIQRHGASLLGQRVMERYGGEFPLLVKFLDSRQWLSLQVHPDDEIVKELEGPGVQGKTEMWHVIDCEPGSELIAGFRAGVGRDDYLRAEGQRELLDLVERHAVEPGRDFYIASGIIHALGPGCLVAEVQQNCDFTYRVYDYGRPRELHFEKARRSLKFNEAHSVDAPVECFSVLSHEAERPADIVPVGGSFQIVMVLKGHSLIDGIPAPAGTTLLISADHGTARLTPMRGSRVSYLTVAV